MVKLIEMELFESNILSIYQSKGKQWLVELPNIVKTLASEWDLTALKPVHNLSFNYVLSGFQKEKPIILKLSLDTEALAREAQALRIFANYGAIDIINEREGVLLLERAVPGTSLKDYASNKAINPIQICCTVMQQLHCASVPNVGFPHIRDWLEALNKDWDMPMHFLKKARTLKRQLLATTTTPVLLHGDLHYDNMLLNGNNWNIIDPKGVIGYPINEVWPFIMDSEKDIAYIANTFHFDIKYILQWYFVHLILAACWNLEDNLEPKLFLDLAEKTYTLV